MITPTVGRIVHFYANGREHLSHKDGVPCAAVVTFVHNDRMVNLTVFDANGSSHPRTSVALLQDNDEAPDGVSYASWMPYQLTQAANIPSIALSGNR